MKKPTKTMEKFARVLIIFVLLSGFCNGQEFCATMEHLKFIIVQDPTVGQKMQAFEDQLQKFILDQGDELKSVNGIVNIPLVYHIVYNTPEENIPDSRVLEQLGVLNVDYRGLTLHGSMGPFDPALKADCEIQFCLAQRDPNGNATTGIERRETTETEFAMDNGVKHLSSGGMDAWDPKKYLNIWVCDMPGMLNYAQPPGAGVNSSYGVVNDYVCVGLTGTPLNNNLGAVTTHELGHCFNCGHIWGGSDTTCTDTDYCNDTPNQSIYVFEPPYIGCTMTDECSPNSPGIMYMNFMDYSRDRFKTNFTPGQKARMQALFTKKGGVLYNLTISDGCVPPAVICNAPVNLSDSLTGETDVTLNWDAVGSAASYLVQYMKAGSSTWTTIPAPNNYLVLEGLLPATNYIWRVQTVCSGGAKSTWSTILTFPTGGVLTCAYNFEPNETMPAAWEIPTGTVVSAGIHRGSDLDWYKFINNAQQKKILVQLYDLPADYNVKLFNSSGVQVGVSQNPGLTEERISYNSGKNGTYYIEVYPAEGAFNTTQCYSLKASISSTSYPAMPGSTAVNEEVIPLPILVYPNPASNLLNIEFNSPSTAAVSLKLTELSGRVTRAYSLNAVVGKNLYPINLGDLADGFYVMALSSNGQNYFRKIIIRK